MDRRRLARYTTWTQEDLAEFNKALSLQRTIDEPLETEIQPPNEDEVPDPQDVASEGKMGVPE